MNKKHTPGPWEFGADPCVDNDAAIAICKQNIDAHKKPSSGYFYVVYVDDGRRTALVGHGPDGAANARLIAAAPELLEALKDAEQALTCGFNTYELREKLRAAIAKATGE